MTARHFLIACGGTGGHLSPGIALAEHLLARGHRATLLISHKRVDGKLIEKYPQLRFVRVPGAGFSWSPVGFCRFVASQVQGLFFNLRLVRREHPDAVVGFGGFTTTTIILAARLRRIPIALHEANRVPGRAIRLLGPLAQRVYTPPGVRLADAPVSVLRHIGLPVRSEIRREPREVARQKLGLAAGQPVVAVLGGSQGATPLNQWASDNASTLALEGIQLYCVTGLGKAEPEIRRLRSRSGTEVAAVFVPFCDRMATVLSAADVVVTRAGAGTLAELMRCATPGILVPFPQAADNHQAANALFFEQQGGGIVVDQTRLVELTREVRELVFNDWLLARLRENLERMDQSHAIDEMLQDLDEMADVTHARRRKEPRGV
ncbi:UDP-N-acetylglucosamine--N-acetylmuramyl-(pentapeptide) pyrophosphoryl-undecaprenol N-acetylglucosamine transferase [Nibricoccus sp. IMCC34717]|uniref:UDP-N-acetylglucosamine--N-acetylmuramyl- (pentapeptide) pyrophosphoryl-undecaprenol N-acetylglucosamine transferase n=1 Tax=Nibricoccus sp. IMCC34717 TaxID=3034021 RepID=UPI00384D95FE